MNVLEVRVGGSVERSLARFGEALKTAKAGQKVKPYFWIGFRSMAQFGETSRLLQERDRATTALAERKLIERAKGIIMKQRGLDEDAAYKFMRQAAMNKNLRLGQLAASIIEAEELLG